LENVDTLGEIASRNSYIAIKSTPTILHLYDSALWDTEIERTVRLKEIKCMLKV
jgi:hypothetical protein